VEAHERVYGYATQSPARVVNLRTVHRVETTAVPEPPLDMPPGEAPVRSHRPIVLDAGAGPVRASIYRRDTLGAGARIAGPSIVEQADTTTVVHPDWTAEVLGSGQLLITRVRAGATEGDRR
jgi:N-methylhydantoinase A/oxoprolinase/acetone carboxylase beta subunit